MKLFLILATILCLADGQSNKATLKSLVVTSDIKVRYARTIVSAEYHNDKNSPTEADFTVSLPHRAYITNFTMNVGGNLSIGEIKEKKVAKHIYDTAVRRGQSAGHVGIRHRFTKQFNMKVNVEPNVKVIFNLTYEELLKRTKGKYNHKIFLSNGNIIDKVLVEVFISDPQEIKVFDENIPKDLRVRSVDYIDNKHVYIRFNPSPVEQQERGNAGYGGEFDVEYDVKRINSSVVYTLDGYFVHFFTPIHELIWPKNIVFMIDVSGSMSGEPIRQVKAALLSILSTLNPQRDTFTFGTFSGDVTWQSVGGIGEAEMFIKSLEANGGTNMHTAMMKGLKKFVRPRTSNMADILFFLTDGDPTSGITNKEIIKEDTRNANVNNVMIFTLGFGENCDHVFLKSLSLENNGVSRKIYDDKDSDKQIKEMFAEFSNVMLKNVIITYVDSSIDVGNITRNEFTTLFNGTEIAIAGPLKKGKEKPKWIEAVFKAENSQKSFEIKQKLPVVDFDLGFISLDDIPQNPNLTRLDSLRNITKKTWAYLTVKKMFADNAPREEIIAMAIKNNFVTPLTSMVVTKEKLSGEETEEEQNKDGSTRKFQRPPILPARRQNQHRPTPAAFKPHRPTPAGVLNSHRVIPNRKIHHRIRQKPHRVIPNRKIHHRILSGQDSQNPQRVIPNRKIHHRILSGQDSQNPQMLLPDQSMVISVHTAPPPQVFPMLVAEDRMLPDIDSTSPAPTTAPTTSPAPTTTPFMCISAFPPSTTPVPILPRLPAIFVKPAKCDEMLCVSQPNDCIKSSRVLIFKDSRSGAEIYGYYKNDSTQICMGDLYRMTLESRGKNVELLPTSIRINRRKFKTKDQQFIRFNFKRFFQFYVFFDQTPKRERISVKFIVKDHMNTATGFYGQYMKEFNCKIQPSGELVLSNMSREFRKVRFTSPEEGFDHCYM